MTDSTSLRIRYKKLRKTLLSFTPFVKRRRIDRATRLLERMQQEIHGLRSEKASLGYLFLERPPFAATARIVMRAPLASSPIDELCLFVTHAASGEIKPHVIDHIEALLANGINVVLIANTDLDPPALRIPDSLAARLHGCIVRENVGFDFAAWAHAYTLLGSGAVRRRLYLINDSIIGPLDLNAYRALLRRVREANADFVGMTRNRDPHDHLQSFFLVINEALLRAPVFDEFMSGVLNMPHKHNVIDCYEIWLTRFFERRGFSNQAIFPAVTGGQIDSSNDTIWRWRGLMELGFPFVKSGVLAYPELRDDARHVIPERYLAAEPATRTTEPHQPAAV